MRRLRTILVAGAVYAALAAAALAQNAGGQTNPETNPAGAATAANQVRAVTYNDANNAAVAASGYSAINSHPVPSPAIYSKFNAVLSMSVGGGTYFVQGSNDNFSTAVTMATGGLSANTAVSVTTSVAFSSYRAYIGNGANAGNAWIATSYTAN